MQKMVSALLLSALLLPAAASAMVPEGTAHIARSISDVEEHSEFSFSSITEGGMDREESSLYFNDGFGRLMEFHMTAKDDHMTLQISQNGREIYCNGFSVKSRRFSVVRREEMGEIYFLITLGERTYRGSIDREDHWKMEEGPSKDEVIPLRQHFLMKT